MRAITPLHLAAVATLALASIAKAAPLPPVPPLDLCGTVLRMAALPAQIEPAIKGISGSAGIERHWPARLAVLLGAVCTDDPDALAMANMFQTGTAGGIERGLISGQAILVLPAVSEDTLILGRTLCVSGYQVSGDEGGTWTRFENLMLLPQSLGAASLDRCAR